MLLNSRILNALIFCKSVLKYFYKFDQIKINSIHIISFSMGKYRYSMINQILILTDSDRPIGRIIGGVIGSNVFMSVLIGFLCWCKCKAYSGQDTNQASKIDTCKCQIYQENFYFSVILAGQYETCCLLHILFKKLHGIY